MLDGSNVVSASDNHIPASSYLAHGSRVLIQIPPTGKDKKPHEFMNWLIHENKERSFADHTTSDNPLFSRSVSSHSTHLESVDKEWCFVEDKGVIVGALDTLATLSKPEEGTHHFGINFAFGVDKLGQDSSGRVIDGPDGEHGHMYLHYRAPSDL